MATSSENVKKDKWKGESTLQLCQFLNNYIMKNGRKSPFKWTELQAEFEKLIGHKFFSDKAMKNKYGSMKQEYNLWKSLKNGETGLGWNESTGKLDCSNEWWAKKIKENPLVKKFQNKQPSLDLQEAWDQLYGDAVASGVDCVAPSIDPSTLKEAHHEDENAEDDDVDVYSVYSQYATHIEDLDNQHETFFPSFINEVQEKDKNTGASKTITKPKPVKMKRKGRESTGATMLKEIVTHNNANQQRVLQMFEPDVGASKFSVEVVVNVLTRMVNNGLMTKGDKLWMFAMDLFEDRVKREVFLSLPDDDTKFAWLLHKQSPGN